MDEPLPWQLYCYNWTTCIKFNVFRFCKSFTNSIAGKHIDNKHSDTMDNNAFNFLQKAFSPHAMLFP